MASTLSEVYLMPNRKPFRLITWPQSFDVAAHFNTMTREQSVESVALRVRARARAKCGKCSPVCACVRVTPPPCLWIVPWWFYHLSLLLSPRFMSLITHCVLLVVPVRMQVGWDLLAAGCSPPGHTQHCLQRSLCFCLDFPFLLLAIKPCVPVT